MLLNRAQRIEQLDKVIKAQKQSLFEFTEKDKICQDQSIYYREEIRKRDKSINRLKRGNKLLKIGCVSFGVSTLVLFGVSLIK